MDTEIWIDKHILTGGPKVILYQAEGIAEVSAHIYPPHTESATARRVARTHFNATLHKRVIKLLGEGTGKVKMTMKTRIEYEITTPGTQPPEKLEEDTERDLNLSGTKLSHMAELYSPNDLPENIKLIYSVSFTKL